jgi:hypothetical protein
MAHLEYQATNFPSVAVGNRPIYFKKTSVGVTLCKDACVLQLHALQADLFL